MIPEAAVEIVERHLRFYVDRPGTDWTVEATAILEAAIPSLLSHEREETRLAHLDAVVNAATVSKYERAVDAVSSLAEYWERTPALRKGPAAADIRAALTEAMEEQ